MGTIIEPFYIKVGKLIQAQRSRLQITQDTLGSLLNPPTTRASIANMEAGKQRILAHTLVQLAKIFSVKVDDLLPKEGELSSNDKPSNIAAELQEKLKIPRATAQKFAEKIELSTKPTKKKRI